MGPNTDIEKGGFAATSAAEQSGSECARETGERDEGKRGYKKADVGADEGISLYRGVWRWARRRAWWEKEISYRRFNNREAYP